MSSNNPLHTRSIWTRIFKRNGGAGEHTKLFEEFDEVSRKAIVEAACLDEDEFPVIASAPTEHSWFLLTTKRLLLFAGGESNAVELPSIASVLPAEFGQARKEELTLLILKLKDGHELHARIEAGPPFFGVWNVLLGVVARSNATT